MLEADPKLFLKNGKTIIKAPIMKSKNLLTENFGRPRLTFKKDFGNCSDSNN